MRVILEKDELIEAVSQWLGRRGIRIGTKGRFEVWNPHGGRWDTVSHGLRLDVDVEVEPVHQEGPYR